jgi:tetratricopeptide (TPR) repeat protein
VDTHIALGRTLQRLGRPEEPADCFHIALHLALGDLRARLGLDDTFFDQHRREEAGRCYRAAIALAPKGADAHNKIAHHDLGAMYMRLAHPRRRPLFPRHHPAAA